MAQQTPVEWFKNEISIHLNFDQRLHLNELFEQAKQMEKEQHENTWIDSRIECKGDDYVGKEKTFEQYYNETFKSE